MLFFLQVGTCENDFSKPRCVGSMKGLADGPAEPGLPATLIKMGT
jgi:hypothetical protein